MSNAGPGRRGGPAPQARSPYGSSDVLGEDEAGHIALIVHAERPTVEVVRRRQGEEPVPPGAVVEGPGRGRAGQAGDRHADHVAGAVHALGQAVDEAGQHAQIGHLAVGGAHKRTIGSGVAVKPIARHVTPFVDPRRLTKYRAGEGREVDDPAVRPEFTRGEAVRAGPVRPDHGSNAVDRVGDGVLTRPAQHERQSGDPNGGTMVAGRLGPLIADHIAPLVRAEQAAELHAGIHRQEAEGSFRRPVGGRLLTVGAAAQSVNGTALREAPDEIGGEAVRNGEIGYLILGGIRARPWCRQ